MSLLSYDRLRARLVSTAHLVLKLSPKRTRRETRSHRTQDASIYGTIGMLVSAAMGVLVRRTFLLRASLALGLCSLGAQAWSTALERRLLDGPSRFVNKRQTEQFILDFLRDPLPIIKNSKKDVTVEDAVAWIKYHHKLKHESRQ